MITITVSEPLQKEYTYEPSATEGKNFDKDFKPELTPKEMLELGVFEGNYFDGYTKEYPKEWFVNAKLSDIKDPKINFFNIAASKPLEYWQMKGWIYFEDPRGWFQWYCRYYMGRRCADDTRQIKRWKQMVRHIAQVRKNCPKGALDCRRKQRQALLHWAYDSRKM